ncbi:MAG: sulfatase-like hydrolase/transferase [Acidobacteriia bacterium]|nr:sulfatase-like hydrolase/transferase [Terriglobia bacterium]MYG02856.1 sulfatase-like hydrolase/transferase [Terriglobia bacterium]MYK10399.1 sulfatase-like hydrolase/transferase [Terriglobia bacterium]
MTLQRVLPAFFSRLCAASCVLATIVGCQGPQPSASLPNIIFLLTDDQRADALSIAGNPILQTPHIDELANDGVRFTEAHVVAPVCMPSRTSFMNGQYERVHQIGFSSPNVLSDAQWDQTYSALLRQQRYHVGFVGKIGLQQYSFRGNPLEKFDFWRGHDDWARFWPKEFEHLAIYHDAEAEIVTPIMSDSIERFLDDAPSDRPFMLSVSFSAPHGSISGSMLYPEEDGATRMTKSANSHPKLGQHPTYGSLYRDANLQPPSTFEDDTAKHIPLDVHPREGRMQTYSYSYLGPDVQREHQVRYYQLIHGIDDAVGQLRESLQRRGIADNTVIVFSSDHGLLMGEYAMGGKSLLYDLTTRVPLIVFDPRAPADSRGTTVDELVLSIDVPATIVALGGLDVPSSMQGRDLGPLLADPDAEWRDEIFIESLFLLRTGPYMEAVRTKDWKYVRFFRSDKAQYGEQDVDFRGRQPDFEQFFDLNNDPGEETNLIAAPSLLGRIQEFRERCRQHSAALVLARQDTETYPR